MTRTKGNRLQIDYDFSTRTVPPRALVVTVNSRNEKGVPPKPPTFVEVATTPKGRLVPDGIALHPARHYDVYASTVAGDPPQPSASALTEIDPVAAEKEPAVGQQIAQRLGRLLARVRGDD